MTVAFEIVLVAVLTGYFIARVVEGGLRQLGLHAMRRWLELPDPDTTAFDDAWDAGYVVGREDEHFGLHDNRTPDHGPQCLDVRCVTPELHTPA